MEDDDSPDRKRNHTIGIAGLESPGACQDIQTIHELQKSLTLCTRPVVRTEFWHNKVYVMLFLFPKNVARHGEQVCLVQAAEWHCTLAVGFPQRPIAPAELQRLDNDVTAVWNAMSNQIEKSPLDGCFYLPLCRPPWKNSWAYGIAPGPFRRACIALQRSSEGLLEDSLDAWCRERRPIHLSWR